MNTYALISTRLALQLLEVSSFMKKMIILGLAVAGLSLSSMTASAKNDDSEYPAAYFQPKVIYADKEAIRESEKTAKPRKRKVEFDPKYPAAYFQPKVIYP
ncbi:hypothetical protein Q9L42_007460 [Methylomarinum sp. Ch1-1]|uniref:Uncharacterized protein n=1 Tax=Methylomarinum roseum TaxID=3067653 RepID=A0AAU7NYA0_9GAMM